MACYEDSFTCLYVDEDRTSQERHLWSATACYGDRFTFLYVNDVISFAIFVILMMEAIHTSASSFLKNHTAQHPRRPYSSEQVIYPKFLVIYRM
jgi:hypothetical protein